MEPGSGLRLTTSEHRTPSLSERDRNPRRPDRMITTRDDRRSSVHRSGSTSPRSPLARRPVEPRMRRSRRARGRAASPRPCRPRGSSAAPAAPRGWRLPTGPGREVGRAPHAWPARPADAARPQSERRALERLGKRLAELARHVHAGVHLIDEVDRELVADDAVLQQLGAGPRPVVGVQKLPVRPHGEDRPNASTDASTTSSSNSCEAMPPARP